MWTQKKSFVREVIVNEMSQPNLHVFSVSRAAEECIQFKHCMNCFHRKKITSLPHHFQEEKQVNKVVCFLKLNQTNKITDFT